MTRTFLRIKRRRTEDPLPFIRLEALNHPNLPSYHQNRTKKRGRSAGPGDGDVADLDSANISDFLEQHHEVPENPSSSLLWKRLEPTQEEAESCRIVDALLEKENEEDVRLNKRRKLTLLETSNSGIVKSLGTSSVVTNRRRILKVLDPLTRLVDDSLQQVHAGSRIVSEHYRFITTDRRLVTSHDMNKWVLWCHSSGGNLLHACALWNDMELAGELLQIPHLAGPLCDALDGDGRTPYEVAQLSGHDSVCEVLEAFGGDTANFVYDIFCLEEGDNEMLYDENYAPTTVELTSGVAYWTPNGELMLEANDKISAYLEDDDGEVDSNCEEFDANDYPEEEEDEDVAWGYEDNRHFETERLNHNQEPCSLDRYTLEHHTRKEPYGQEGEVENYIEHGDLDKFP